MGGEGIEAPKPTAAKTKIPPPYCSLYTKEGGWVCLGGGRWEVKALIYIAGWDRIEHRRRCWGGIEGRGREEWLGREIPLTGRGGGNKRIKGLFQNIPQYVWVRPRGRPKEP